MLVHELLGRSASRAPEAVAVVDAGRVTAYAELDRRATAIASALMDAGVQPGDRVVLALSNSVEFVASYFGILRASAVVVPLQPGPRSDRLARAVADCTPAAYIVDKATWPIVSVCSIGSDARFIVSNPSSTALPDGVLRLPGLESIDVASHPFTSHAGTHETDLAAIIYTSGSTGAPRGVMLTHRNILANTASIVEYLSLSAADRMMVVLPFYYVYGLSLLHTHVAVGGSLVLDNRFAFPNVIVRAMADHAVTGLAGVPSTYALLLHNSSLASTPLPALRYVTQAGGPMPPARLREWLRVMPNVPFFVMYGATEASARLAYLPPSELPRRIGSIGRPIPGVELFIRRDDGSRADVGEVGEIVARGANISPGYWQSPEETRERFGADGFRTGDLGLADADGYFFLVGRRHDMFKVGGHRVSAKEIEEALHEHPLVHEAAVVAEPHDLLGEAPVAHLALREACELTASEILEFCRTVLPEHKVPVHVMFHATLPKNESGKIAKAALRSVANAEQVG
jgi:long-chain acyl-CoA synthetase